VIELHTGTYANATGEAKARELARLQHAAEFAATLGIQVNAGHGLDYQNTQAIAAILQMQELNIGHSIVARAIFVGLEQATREMLELMQTARAAACA
jgi:pyridoxine 5-phosphate synthase